MGYFSKKNKSVNPVILLTSCVNPNGMYETNLTNKDIRYKQYCLSIDYLLKTTKLNIVVVDNTNIDYSQRFSNSRLEILYFDGNHFNRSYGKGYGEVEIISYALKKSTFISKSNYIIKLTGRTPLINIDKYFTFYNINENTVLVDMPYRRMFRCYSRVIFAPKSFYYDYFLKDALKINDSLGYYFEDHLYNSLEKALHDKKIKLKLVLFPFIFKGVSGTDGKPLKIKWIQIIKTFIGNSILNYNISRGYIYK